MKFEEEKSDITPAFVTQLPDGTKSSPACAHCPALCCQLIFLSCNEKLLRKWIDTNQLTDKEKPDVDRIRALFQPVWFPEYINRKYVVSLGRKSYPHICRGYDYSLGHCTRYNDRPGLCKSFICHGALSSDLVTQIRKRTADCGIQYRLFQGSEPLRRWLIRHVQQWPRFSVAALWFWYEFRLNPRPALVAFAEPSQLAWAKLKSKIRYVWLPRLKPRFYLRARDLKVEHKVEVLEERCELETVPENGC